MAQLIPQHVSTKFELVNPVCNSFSANAGRPQNVFMYSVVCCSFPVPIILKQKLPGYTKSFKTENIIYTSI